MKFRVTMKDPDVLQDAIEEAVNQNKLPLLDEREMKLVRETRIETVLNQCNNWFEYGEYLTVEIDTDAHTCAVIPVGN